MKVVQINSVCDGSTGKIAIEISKLLNEKNIENYIFYSFGNTEYKNAVKYSKDTDIKISALCSKIFGNYGFTSKKITRKLIKELKKINPDIIHLHNLHGHNVDLKMLFEYLAKTDIKVLWTFHDCWTFTAYCTHFDYIKCDKWKTECKNCPQYKNHSWFFDRSQRLYNKKKKLFTSVKNLTIVTPSKWLADLVKKSFFSEFPTEVIYNGIDVEVFKPRESDFRERYNLKDKRILLGVAAGMGEKKGYKYFFEISKMLSEDTKIVLVGLSKERIKELPSNIIGVERTSNQKELAEIYTAADVFINPTLEEVLGLVNIEALACETPVVMFDTGGSPECVDNTCGIVVKKGDAKALFEAAQTIERSGDECRKRVLLEFDAKKNFEKYVTLYNKVIDEK